MVVDGKMIELPIELKITKRFKKYYDAWLADGNTGTLGTFIDASKLVRLSDKPDGVDGSFTVDAEAKAVPHVSSGFWSNVNRKVEEGI